VDPEIWNGGRAEGYGVGFVQGALSPPQKICDNFMQKRMHVHAKFSLV